MRRHAGCSFHTAANCAARDRNLYQETIVRKYLFLFFLIALSSCSQAHLFSASQDNDVSDDPLLLGFSQADRTDSAPELIVDATDERAPLSEPAANKVESAILAMVNRAREDAGLKPLARSLELAAAARSHTDTMAAKGFFEHRGAGEPPLVERVHAAGLHINDVGENIYATDEAEPDEIANDCVTAWMLSPGHRENILYPDFQRSGVAIATSSDRENYVTEDFSR
jgi:uncharacterized protein YkwD